MCPRCFSLERHRLLYAYMKQESDLFNRRARVLHFAPERCLGRRLAHFHGDGYVSADLMVHFLPGLEMRPTVVMSVTDIHFPDNYFDYVICNHVLEHVPDDRSAMREIRRVLKPGGMAVLMVPLDMFNSEIVEEPNLSRDERRRRFGSPDHVRMYGVEGYRKRLREAGLAAEIFPYSRGIRKENRVTIGEQIVVAQHTSLPS